MLPDHSEWTFDALEAYDKAIAELAQEYKLDTFPIQLEMITAEQMLDAYASSGMPINYTHWTFGKHFIDFEKQYKRGGMGLAYEIVINSNPCIAYLMEENTLPLQALVIAHACYGHNSFFKSNYLFKTWTSPDAIIDYLLFAKSFIRECEEHHGVDAVEEILDSCHALMNYGVDRYRHPNPLSIQEEKARQIQREKYLQTQVNELWRTIPQKAKKETTQEKRFPEVPEENILYFIEKNALLLEPWQREIIRIVRKTAQYFYPQKQTKVMNEGWACFWHYHLIQTLFDRKQVSEKFMLEFIDHHASVIYQPEFGSPYYSGINPYALGFNMFIDLKRICEHPTDEDNAWFPEIAGSNWQETLDFAMRNFKDESFIAQFLSPKIIRELKLFTAEDDDHKAHIEIQAIHNDHGYDRVRQALSAQYNLSMIEPNIQVYNVNIAGNRSLILHHTMHNRRPLGETTQEVLKHLHRLWGFSVVIESIDEHGKVAHRYECPEP